MTKIIIPGEPVPKQRPRVTRRGITYTPAKTQKYERLVQEIYNKNEYYEKGVPLKFRVDAFFSVPKSWSKKKQQQALNGELYVTKRPDGDNILKICMDALNGVAFYDDSQIVEMSISKHYSENPRVEIEIERKEKCKKQ